LPGIGLGRDKTLRNRISTPTKKIRQGQNPKKHLTNPKTPFQALRANPRVRTVFTKEFPKSYFILKYFPRNHKFSYRIFLLKID